MSASTSTAIQTLVYILFSTSLLVPNKQKELFQYQKLIYLILSAYNAFLLSA